MIYNISEHTLESMLDDERLIAEIMRTSHDITTTDAQEKIKTAYGLCLGFVKHDPVKSSDHQPCIECGGIEFMRTGTCFVCGTCGSSQGCS